MAEKKTSVAVLGVGLIGIDLIGKIQRSQVLDCRLVVGRDRQAFGLRRAAEMGCATCADGIEGLVEAGPFDVVFDASNADAHAVHWPRLLEAGTKLIDLTPSRIGTMVVPTVNGPDVLAHRHLNLITCGGQASIPLLHAIVRHVGQEAIEYVEVVSSGASSSAGRATRLNLDDYIETTQSAVNAFTGAQQAKVMINLSPAKPPPPFRVTITVLTPEPRPDLIRAVVETAAKEVRTFTPGFTVTSCETTDDRIRIAVEVTAEGGPIPGYAGNLDIINAAAVLLAEQHHATRAA
jgi:acetaldehyde dehydrogenase